MSQLDLIHTLTTANKVTHKFSSSVLPLDMVVKELAGQSASVDDQEVLAIHLRTESGTVGGTANPLGGYMSTLDNFMQCYFTDLTAQEREDINDILTVTGRVFVHTQGDKFATILTTRIAIDPKEWLQKLASSNELPEALVGAFQSLMKDIEGLQKQVHAMELDLDEVTVERDRLKKESKPNYRVSWA